MTLGPPVKGPGGAPPPAGGASRGGGQQLGPEETLTIANMLVSAGRRQNTGRCYVIVVCLLVTAHVTGGSLLSGGRGGENSGRAGGRG